MLVGRLDIAIPRLFRPLKKVILLKPRWDSAIATLAVPLEIARRVALKGRLGVIIPLAMATLSMCLQH